MKRTLRAVAAAMAAIMLLTACRSFANVGVTSLEVTRIEPNRESDNESSAPEQPGDISDSTASGGLMDTIRDIFSDIEDLEPDAGEVGISVSGTEESGIWIGGTAEPVTEAAETAEMSTSESTDSDVFLMPYMLGMTLEEAESRYSGLMTIIPEHVWSEAPKGMIFDQEYPEGRKVKTGTEVAVKVSMGIRLIEIQDLENLSVEIAARKLEDDGFKVKKTYEESDDIPRDYVIRSEPAAHETAAQGSPVVLVISMGAMHTSVYVPKFIDLPLSVALQRAEEYYLNATVRYDSSEKYDKDVVMGQSIDSGSMVDRDTEIELVVSSGEISEKPKMLKFSLPKNATGEFEFRYYVDGVLDKESFVILDLGLPSSKSLAYTVTGKAGETRVVTVEVTSVETGKSGTYMEIIVNFPEDGSKPTASNTANSNIFTELS